MPALQLEIHVLDEKKEKSGYEERSSLEEARLDDDEDVSGAFCSGAYVVYPKHGVGCVQSIEQMQIDDRKQEVVSVLFEKDRMTLRIPRSKVASSGLRAISTSEQFAKVFSVLKGRSRVRRAMWSRRAQEYEAKIHSGDPVLIAEVIRELHRSSEPQEQSYSERQMYQVAIDRLSRELAVLENISEAAAVRKIQGLLLRKSGAHGASATPTAEDSASATEDADPSPENPKDADPSPENPKDAEPSPENPKDAEPSPENPKALAGKPKGRRALAGKPKGRRALAGKPKGRRALAGKPKGPLAGKPKGRRPLAGKPKGCRPLAGKPKGRRALDGKPKGRRARAGLSVVRGWTSETVRMERKKNGGC